MSYVDVTGLELKVTTNLGNSVAELDRLQSTLAKLNTDKLIEVSHALKNLSDVNISKDIANIGKAVINFNTALQSVDTKTLHNQANNLKKALTPLANILERIQVAAKGLDFTGVAKAAQAINKAGLGTTGGGRRSTPAAASTAPASTLAMKTSQTSLPIEQIFQNTFSTVINDALSNIKNTAPRIPEVSSATAQKWFSERMSETLDNAIKGTSAPRLPAQTQAGTAYAIRDSLNEKLNMAISNATAMFSTSHAAGSMNASLASNMSSAIRSNISTMTDRVMSDTMRQVADGIAHSTGTVKLPATTTSTVANKVREDIARIYGEGMLKLPATSSASMMGMGGARPETPAKGKGDMNFFGQEPKVSVWAKIKSLISGSAKNAKELASGVKEAGNEADKAESKFAKVAKSLMYGGSMKSDMAQTAKDLFGVLSKGFGNLQTAVLKAGTAFANFAKGPLSMVFNPFRNLAVTIKDAATRFTKFFAALKRVAIYRAIRGLLKAVTQGLKEGIENLYQWSKITGGDFAAAMDQIATASLYVKNSLAAMVSPIITYVAPAIDMLADKFVALLNIMNQVFARITGRATWTEALKYPTKYAENTAGATKKIKDNIQDFDELHILRTPNSGGSGDNLDYNNLFKESEFTNDLFDWVGEFQRALKNSQFYKAGTILGDALNDIIQNKIPWGDLGKTLGTKIDDIFEFAVGTLKTFNFVGMGEGIAEFLNNCVKAIEHPENIGTTLAYKIQGVVETAFGFAKDADWWGYGQFFSGVVTGWFETIDGLKIGQTISTAIHGALTFVESFLEDDYKWDLIAEDIAGLINGIDWFGILSRTLKIGVKIFNAIIRVIRRAINGEQAEPVSEIFESTDMWRIDYLTRQANGTLNTGTGSMGNSISNTISTAISEVDFMDIAEPLYELLKAAWDFAWDLVIHGGMALGEKIAKDISDVYRGGHWEEDVEGNVSWQQANERSAHMRFAEGSAAYINPYNAAGIWGGGIYGLLAGLGANTTLGSIGLNNRRNMGVTVNAGASLIGANNPIAALLGALGAGDRRQGSNGNVNARRFAKAPSYDSSAKSMARFAEETKKQEFNLTELYKMSESSSGHMAEHWENAASKIEGRVTAKFASTKDQISATITGLTTESSEKFNALGTTMSNSLSGVASAMVSPLNEIKGQITGAFSEAGELTKEDIGNLAEVVRTSLNGVQEASADGLSKVNGVWNGLKDNMKTAGNGIIDIAEKVGNSIVDAFNAMGQNLKSYDGLTFPDGTRINLSTVKVSPHLNIPRLAEGGIIGSPTVAMVGEAGREAILPLDNNTGWMDEFAEKVGGGAEEIALLREQNELLRQIAAKKMGITPNEVFNAVREENRDYFVRTGNNALVM